ncbi:hypothetical protein [Halobacteriovorax sp.]|uniref:hypothetical protein n=1 Tax=Halobacteriovorax sp. TaxID=2020862 RepID=UPI003567425E
MFRSGLTHQIYCEFLDLFELTNSKVHSSPFVYVDPENGEIRLVTGMSSNSDGDIITNSVASHGELETFSTRE